MVPDPEAPDIEAALAQRVIDYREAHAGFQAPEEITEVPGIGQGLYGQRRHRLMVSNGTDKDVDEDERSTTTEAKSNIIKETEKWREQPR